MKQKIIFTLILLTIWAVGFAQEKPSCHLLKQGELADVWVDKTLFESEDGKSFFVKFILKNKTDKKLGAQLEEYFALYPNQWLIHLENYEVFTFEKQMEPEKLDFAKKDELNFDYNYNRLEMIEPGDSLIYYKQFGAKDRKALNMVEKQLLTINFDGQLFLSDGKKQYEVIDTYGDDEVDRNMTISYPARWKKLPEDCLVIYYPE